MALALDAELLVFEPRLKQHDYVGRTKRQEAYGATLREGKRPEDGAAVYLSHTAMVKFHARFIEEEEMRRARGAGGGGDGVNEE